MYLSENLRKHGRQQVLLKPTSHPLCVIIGNVDIRSPLLRNAICPCRKVTFSSYDKTCFAWTERGLVDLRQNVCYSFSFFHGRHSGPELLINTAVMHAGKGRRSDARFAEVLCGQAGGTDRESLFFYQTGSSLSGQGS